MAEPLRPGIGDRCEDHRAVCSYSGPRPGPSTCQAPATVHLMLDYPAGADGVVGLASCDTHLGIARAAGTVLAEHPHTGLCGLPGTVWLPEPDNVCVIDDSGVEPTALYATNLLREPR